MQRHESFDAFAELYNEVRPPYPEQLFFDIIAKTGIKPGDRLLEIGPGTGQATTPFARKGFRIHAVELGSNLAEILMAKCIEYPNVVVRITSFEEWNPETAETFALVCAAQSFHWIDAEIKYGKCHGLLKENGYLALFWHDDPDAAPDPVITGIRDMIRKRLPGFYQDRTGGFARRMEARKTEIIESGLFTDPEILEYPWETTLDADTYIKGLNTYSKYALLDDDLKRDLNIEAKRVIENSGGYVQCRRVSVLFLSRRI